VRIYSPLPLAARATCLASQNWGFGGCGLWARTTPLPIWLGQIASVVQRPVSLPPLSAVGGPEGARAYAAWEIRSTVKVMDTNTRAKWLTTQETCKLLQVSPDTFAKWRAKRVGPPARRLPNGSLRFREDLVLDWLDGLAA